MSQMALRRNYESAVARLGGVEVSTVALDNAAPIAASGDEYEMRKKLRILELNMSYDAYVIRTPEKRAWVVLMFNDKMRLSGSRLRGTPRTAATPGKTRRCRSSAPTR